MRASTDAFSPAGSSAEAGLAATSARTSPSRASDRRPIALSFAHASANPPRCPAPAPARRRRPPGGGGRPARDSPRPTRCPSDGRTRAPAVPRARGRASRTARGASPHPRRAPPARPTRAPARAGTAVRPRRRTRRRASQRAQARASTRGGKTDRGGALDEPALLAAVRPQRDHRAEEEHETGEPDEVDEGLHEDTEVDAAVGVDLLGDDEEIL